MVERLHYSPRKEKDFRTSALRYLAQAKELESYLNKSSRYSGDYQIRAKDNFLEAANLLRKSLRALSGQALKDVKKKMLECYDSAIKYSSGEEKKKIQQEKNYADLHLRELEIKEELEKLALNPQQRETTIKKLREIKDKYQAMEENLNIPEIYYSNEKNDLSEKIKKISNKILDYKFIQAQNSLGVGGLEDRLIVAIISISLLASALFFTSMSLSGNVIGEIAPDYSRIVGVILFICGLICSFMYLQKEENGDYGKHVAEGNKYYQAFQKSKNLEKGLSNIDKSIKAYTRAKFIASPESDSAIELDSKLKMAIRERANLRSILNK